jgi:uncharacterized metal-binding protein YceD (DUF177 family)
VTASEFPRPFRAETIGDEARSVTIAADPAERAALARRFGLEAIARLEAEAMLRRESGHILAIGRLSAQVVQTCVASGAPVPATIDEAFRLRFLPETEIASGEEIELSEEDCNTIPYADGTIDLGEAVAEELALAIDPFPRAPDAEAVLRAAGVVAEEDAVTGPFAGLKALRDRLAD